MNREAWRRPSSTHRTMRLAAGGAVGLLLSASALSAADESAQQGADLARATALLGKHQWAEAEALLRRAWALNPTYDVAANLGQTQYHLGKLRDAAEHLDFALRHWPLIGKPEPRKLAEDRLAEVRGSVGALKLEVKAEHADLYVDGKLVGHSPMVGEVFVEPGAHKVEARHELYGTEARRVIAGVGATEAVRFGLGEVVAGVGVPGAAGAGPVVPQPPPVPAAKRPIWPVVVSGSLAAVGIAVGAGLAGAANGKSGDADAIGARLSGRSTCASAPSTSVVMDCQAVKSALRGQSTLTDAARGSFVVGGLAALGAASLGVWTATAPKQQKNSVRVAPLLGTTEGGLTVFGTW